MTQKFLDKLPKTFPHRFQETEESLERREWTKDDSFEKTISKIVHNCTYCDDDLYCDLLFRHHFYCAATAPFDEFVYDFDELMRFFDGVCAGDYVEVWEITEEPKYYLLKCPNENGLFPKLGSY